MMAFLYLSLSAIIKDHKKKKKSEGTIVPRLSFILL